MPAPIVIADSITRVGPEAAAAVVVNASHGGIYAAYLAAKLHAAAAIFNDAGAGREAGPNAELEARLSDPVLALHGLGGGECFTLRLLRRRRCSCRFTLRLRRAGHERGDAESAGARRGEPNRMTDES